MGKQKQRIKKVSNGTAKGAKRSPMSETWKILNDKGKFQSLKRNGYCAGR